MTSAAQANYAHWIEQVWQGQVSLPGLIEYAETLEGHPALAATLYRTWLARNRTTHDSAVWFNLGVTLNAAADTEAADEAYRKAIALNPKLFQAHLNLGLNLERQGQLDAAIAQWQEVEKNADEEEPQQRHRH